MLDREGRETGDYVNPPDAGYFRWEHPNRDSQKTPRWVSNQIVWMYYSRSNQGFFSHIGSGAQRLPNGNTLICAMTEGHFFEVTPQADVVWEYINPVTTDGVVRVLKDAFPMSNAVFRAYRYGPDHPALRGRDLKPMGLLTDLAEQGVIKTSLVYRRSTDGQLSVVLEDSGGANGLAIDAAGKLVLCQGELGRVARLDKDGSLTALAEEYDGKRFNKPNDLWIAPNGGIYFSDPLYGRGTTVQDGEHVYYLPPNGKPVIRVADDLERPNGLVGSADGKSLYITDHGAGITYRYAIQSDGTLADRTLFAEIGADGLALDSHGNLYLAEEGIVVLDPTGRRVRTFETPEQPTNVCLVENESKLFVTARTRILSIRLGGPQGEPRGGQRGQGGGDPNRKPWLVVHAAEMDKNHDGFLERSELQEACREVFSMYDRNADGTLAVDEYAGGRGEAPHTMGGFVRQHRREIDANADGRITLDELLALAGELFDKSDRQRTGRIVADPAIAPSNNPDYAPPKRQNP